MTEIKKIKLSETDLEQISGGLSLKQIIPILIIAGAACITVAYYLNQNSNQTTNQSIQKESKKNFIYQDSNDVGHFNPKAKAPSSKSNSNNIIYQDNNGVGHFQPNDKITIEKNNSSGFVGFFDDK